MTRIGGNRVRVKVLGERARPGSRIVRFEVARADTGIRLPKARTAVSLHPIRSGESAVMLSAVFECPAHGAYYSVPGARLHISKCDAARSYFERVPDSLTLPKSVESPDEREPFTIRWGL